MHRYHIRIIQIVLFILLACGSIAWHHVLLGHAGLATVVNAFVIGLLFALSYLLCCYVGDILLKERWKLTTIRAVMAVALFFVPNVIVYGLVALLI